jgi:hypothetical protein
MKKILAVVMLFCSAACVLSVQSRAQAPDPAQAANTSRGAAYSAKEIEVRTSTQKLFTQCLNRQRKYAAIALYGPGDPAQARLDLEKTTDNIGQVFKTYYGEQQGEQLASIFKQYILLTVDYVSAVKGKADTAAVIDKMNVKGGQLVPLFNVANNPKKNPRIAQLLKNYTNGMTAEVDLQGKGQRAPDPALYGETFKSVTELADRIVTKLVGQFPEKFK